mmetsp:Transcript_700/g.1578  ORF Transcript_700/g.1578 Transcript_700/m.1578 type:complete len:255 (+) Transcript_700:315-1079(+)
MQRMFEEGSLEDSDSNLFGLWTGWGSRRHSLCDRSCPRCWVDCSCAWSGERRGTLCPGVHCGVRADCYRVPCLPAHRNVRVHHVVLHGVVVSNSRFCRETRRLHGSLLPRTLLLSSSCRASPFRVPAVEAVLHRGERGPLQIPAHAAIHVSPKGREDIWSSGTRRDLPPVRYCDHDRLHSRHHNECCDGFHRRRPDGFSGGAAASKHRPDCPAVCGRGVHGVLLCLFPEGCGKKIESPGKPFGRGREEREDGGG